MNKSARYALYLLMSSLAACATQGDKPVLPETSTEPDLQALSYTPQPGLQGIMPALAGHRVVLVGESHNRYDHHQAQLLIIQALYARHPDLAIGLEFFQQPFQSVLDDYIAGRIDEATLLHDSEYYSRWGYDYRLYRPILRYAREHGIPLLALNVARELTGRIGEVGIAGLTPQQRESLPDGIEAALNPRYRERLMAVYRHHNGNTGHAFERFYQVQLAWDEGMAQQAAQWLKAHPQRHLVILAGAGHVNADDAIPARLRRRLPVDIARVVLDGAMPSSTPRGGDYYLITDEQTLPRAGLLGVMLDNSEQPPRITGFSANSDARSKGVVSGDRIVSIDGRTITDYAELKYALMARKPGESVKLGVVRSLTGGGKQRRDYSVRLN